MAFACTYKGRNVEIDESLFHSKSMKLKPLDEKEISNGLLN